MEFELEFELELEFEFEFEFEFESGLVKFYFRQAPSTQAPCTND